jgi:hypothetical protein
VRTLMLLPAAPFRTTGHLEVAAAEDDFFPVILFHSGGVWACQRWRSGLVWLSQSS